MAKPSLRDNQLEPTQSKPAKRWLKLPMRQPTAKMQSNLQPNMQVEGFSESAASAVERDPVLKPPVNPPAANPPAAQPAANPLANQRWHWPLVWFSAFAVLGGMGTAALVWLVSLPPQVNCKHPEQLSLDMERLYCAQEAAQSGEMAKLIAGIDLLKQWPDDHPLHGEAQRLITEWSDQVLTISTQRVVRGDLKGAEAALSHLPSTTPIYQDAQKALGRWRKYSQRATNLNAKAQEALKQKDWNAVSDYIVLLAAFERDYWELEHGADALAQRLGVEKQAWQTLSRVQKMAINAQQMGAAISLAQQIPSQTYAAAAAKDSLRQWSRKLVEAGNQKWIKGDRLGAIATLRLDPKVVSQPEIEDLYRFSHAYRLANPALSDRWLPTAGNMINLAEAIAAMDHVKPDSPFRNQAQLLKKSWQAQMDNLIQLKYASATARFEHPAMLGLAVQQAQQISAQAPRRLQAQTLIAHWQQEAQRVEDQPIVNRAMRLAKGGTIESFKAAIAAASQIPLGRALRQQSQTLIASWRVQIQTLEDRPKLEQATDLAQQGKLEQAIQTASQIGAGRALYRNAQNAIADWRYQQVVDIQTAQDQPILDQAMAQAASGQLSAAIRTASRIGSGRALSSRAQSSIRQWETQLNPPQPSPQPEPSDNSLFGEPTGLPTDPSIDPFESYLSPNGAGSGADSGAGSDSQSERGYSDPLPASPSPETRVSPQSQPSSNPWLPTEIQTVPAPGTYQPINPPYDPPYSPPPDSERDQPAAPPSADPLPPVDPLPPRP
ncbi:MAG: hypothetical protein KME07_15870 [Pegethrix bostrychoides GSE-TBD4-15B]|jgi:uncharacterized protein (UPF0548 family)|uniref:Chromosome segregation ATPase n=1 Tax=Pegethrix bostrychoides GSE-TBD4-15B TaxID=2839662 RepID=A0A951PCN1_9CYAN|nr:hypothetical protein [Pegethrix bostrychoides GSE-TBD4-15B]